MRADLMGAPGHKLDLQQGQPSADSQRFIPGDDLLRAALLRDYLLKDAERGIVRITDTTAGGFGRPNVTQR